ncbi:MAG TPA: cupin domain-containing protein [Xanthobacteraceae bacterium]|nr:cupin domain-containing protein [Xanthobacteraceae bacterium]
MPAPLHLVVPQHAMQPEGLGVYEGRARGLSRIALLDRATGSVHVGYAMNTLAPGGEIERCLHAYEKAIYVIEGALELERDGYLFALPAGGYALVSTALPHALRNAGGTPARWVEVCAPQPKPADGWQDTFFLGPADWRGAQEGPPLGDPRARLIGRSEGTMPPGADMHGDLRGFSIKHFLNAEAGAVHLTMFTVEFAHGGLCNHHDHPFEEAYLILDGSVDVVFDGRRYTLARGDFAWTGVGSRHAFFPAEGRPVRWLEIQAPQPPVQNGIRWHARWEELARSIIARTKRRAAE